MKIVAYCPDCHNTVTLSYDEPLAAYRLDHECSVGKMMHVYVSIQELMESDPRAVIADRTAQLLQWSHRRIQEALYGVQSENLWTP